MNKVKEIFRKMMVGRYGVDYLGRDMMWVSIVLLLITSLTQIRVFWYLAMAVLIWVYFRMFSRNIGKRYEENRKYMNWRTPMTRSVSRQWKQLKDFPKYKYLTCPQCKTKMRIPRGKKNIVVTCPKCRHKFDAKS